MVFGNWRALLVSTCSVCLGACGINGGKGSGASSPDDLRAEKISYNLPQTHATVESALTLVECGKTGPIAKVSVSIVSKAVRNPNTSLHFDIEGSEIASFTESREVKLGVHPHGGLKSISATSTDRSGAIVGNFFKTLVTFGLLNNEIMTEPTVSECNQATRDALEARNRLVDQIHSIRRDFIRPGNSKSEAEEIQALATEVARLETGPLQLKLKQDIIFVSERRSGLIAWPGSAFSKWGEFGNRGGKETEATSLFSLVYCARDEQYEEELLKQQSELLTPKQAEKRGPCGQIANGSAEDIKRDNPTINCKDDEGCKETLVLRQPRLAKVEIYTRDENFYGGLEIGEDGNVLGAQRKPRHAKVASKDMFIAQWGEVSYIPFSVAFGDSKSVSMTLDEFGQVTSFGWKSGARAEGVLAGLNEIYSGYSAATADEAPTNTELAEQKTKIDELSTLKELNALEACRAILEAGGFQCPDS